MSFNPPKNVNQTKLIDLAPVRMAIIMKANNKFW